MKTVVVKNGNTTFNQAIKKLEDKIELLEAREQMLKSNFFLRIKYFIKSLSINPDLKSISLSFLLVISKNIYLYGLNYLMRKNQESQTVR